jgi:tetratricopeptide (TPR) repeat protein
LALAHAALGFTFSDKRQHEKSIPYFRKAIEFDTNNIAVYARLATDLNNIGRFDDAINISEDGLRLNQSESHLHYTKGFALWRLGKLDKAEAALRAAIRFSPNLPLRAHVERLLQEITENRASGETTLGGRQDQGSQVAARRHIDAAEEHEENGRIKEAITSYLAAIELAPDNAQALNDLAWILVDSDTETIHRDAKKALSLAKKAVQLTKREDTDILDTLAIALFSLGELKEAVKVQKEIVGLMASKNASGGALAHTQAKLKRYREALKAKDGHK